MPLAIPNDLTGRFVREQAAVWPILVVAAGCWMAVPFAAMTHMPALCLGTDDAVDRASAGIAFLIDQGMAPAMMLHWSLMAGAMMLPLLMPAARHVAVRSFRSRKRRAQMLLLAGFWLTWSAMGMLALAARAAGIAWPPVMTWLAAGSAALAVVWQLSSGRAYALRRCNAGAALRPRGLAADRDCLAYGVRQALSCARTCLPAMCAMSLSPLGHLFALPMTWLLLRERRRGPPRSWLMTAMLIATGLSTVISPLGLSGSGTMPALAL